MQTQEYQLRFVAYATANGRTPEDQIAHDEVAYPGGSMTGYILWNQQKWSEWMRANGRKNRDYLTPEDHGSFDRFIGIYSNGR